MHEQHRVIRIGQRATIPGAVRFTQMNIWTSRAAEMSATFMIGDGFLGLLQPRRHVALWQDDALGAQAVVAPFRDRPGRRRLYGAVQLAAGLWLASRQRGR